MLRRSLCAGFVLLAVGGIVLADTIRGVITDVKDTKISVTVFKGKFKKGERPETEKKTFSVSKDTKVVKGTGRDTSEASSLSALQEAVSSAGKGKGKLKGVFAAIETDAGKATKITYFAGFGKGKRKEKE
jgi:hypothetical protein